MVPPGSVLEHKGESARGADTGNGRGRKGEGNSRGDLGERIGQMPLDRVVALIRSLSRSSQSLKETKKKEL